MVDGRIDFCDMHITFLDLDDDNHEFLVIDKFIDEDIMDQESLDLIMILNGTMLFHRSRRIEKKEQQGIIEFL